jgi:hypothetical protein
VLQTNESYCTKMRLDKSVKPTGIVMRERYENLRNEVTIDIKVLEVR